MNTTKIVRSPKDKENPFTRMSNSIGNLRADEIGIMFQILSHSDNWVLNKNDVMKKSKLGKARFERAWNHLKELGYIVINKLPMKDGKFCYSYIIYEIPEVQNPDTVVNEPYTDYRSTDNGSTEIGATNNNYIINNNEITTATGVDPRNGVEGDTCQNILGPGDKIEIENVPTPSLRYGECRDIQEEVILEPKITTSTDSFWLETEEIEFTEDELENFTNLLDDMFKSYKLPNWKILMKNNPLHTFLQLTSKIHKGDIYGIGMIETVYRYVTSNKKQ